MIEVIVWGGLTRMLQAIAEGAPTLVAGLLVAGVMRRLLGAEMTLRVFGGGSIRSLFAAWLAGMLLPVCSLGVIPVAYEMRRAGATGGTVLAFVLTAPLFNPLSLLYGLTLAAPVVIVVFALCALLLVTLLGTAWDRLFPHHVCPVPRDVPVPPGIRRMLAVGASTAEYAVGPTLRYCGIALCGTVLLSVLFPKGTLGNSFAHDDPFSPLLMLLVAPLAYATPLTVMMQIGSMFVHGNSVGAAYILLVLGTGMNLGTIAWSWSNYGGRETLTFMLMLSLVVLGMAYAMEQPLYTAGNVAHAHTHAFDNYSAPFEQGAGSLSALMTYELSRSVQMYQLYAVAGLLVLIVVGMALTRGDRREHWEAWLVAPIAASTRRNYDIDVSPQVLGLVGIAGLVVLSGVGCYIYYPPPQETLEQMVIARVDVFSSVNAQNAADATMHIQRYDELTRKLQVGYFLREWRLDEWQQLRAKVLRGRLEQLKDLVEAGEMTEARGLALAIGESHRRCREVFSAGER